MKTIRVTFISLSVLLIISLPSCEKEEVVDTKTYIVVNWLRNFNTCQTALAFCLTPDGMDKRTADAIPLAQDQAITAPMLLTDGSVVMEMKMLYGDLSDQAKMLFFEEEHLLIEQDFILSATTMKQAYDNSGKTYSGQLSEVVSGLYVIEREGRLVILIPDTEIKIIITYKDGVLTIKLIW